jgi:hypothetical protein
MSKSDNCRNKGKKILEEICPRKKRSPLSRSPKPNDGKGESTGSEVEKEKEAKEKKRKVSPVEVVNETKL